MPDSSEVEQPAEPVISKADRVDRIINTWMFIHIYGSAVSRSTEAYNHLRASLGHLRDMIVKEI